MLYTFISREIFLPDQITFYYLLLLLDITDRYVVNNISRVIFLIRGREHLENLYNEIQQLNFFQKLLLNLGILVIPYLALELLMHWLYIFNGDNP